MRYDAALKTILSARRCYTLKYIQILVGGTQNLGVGGLRAVDLFGAAAASEMPIGKTLSDL